MSSRTVYRACNLCEAICGLAIEVEEDRVVSVRGDEQDPFSRGHICPKGAQIARVHEDPDRLRRPLIRTSDGWREAQWPEALSLVATRLHEIKSRHGADAVGIYAGNPNVHNYGSILFGPRFYGKLGTKNFFSATSLDQLPHHVASLYMFGHSFLLPVPDIDRTKFFLILGANPMASNGSIMTVPDFRNRLKAVQARGGRVVTVDPRRTETAELADEHYFIRPGTDALLLLSLLNVIVAENLLKADDRVLAISDGLGEIKTLVADFAPERTASVTGITSQSVRSLARDFAAAEGAVAYGRIGLSTQGFGGLCQWLLSVLNTLTGNLDRPGGAMFPLGAVDTTGGALGASGGSFDRYRSRVRGLPEFSGEFPASTMADEMLTPGEGQVRALATSAGNPVLSAPNGRRLEEALEKLEFMVSVDIYLNETTRHAHVILPPTSMLEHDHYDVIFHGFAVRNTTRLSPAVFPKPEGALDDHEIFSDLAKRLDLLRSGKPLPTEVIAAKMGPHDFLNHMLRGGPYGTTHNLSVTKLAEHPHGIDLGPLRPAFPERLRTKDRRIDLTPEIFVKDVGRLRTFLAEREAAGAVESLELIGRRHLRSNNSWMHNVPKLVSGADRCTLMIHPTDADRRQVADGDLVRVRSRVGEVRVRAELTDSIMPGVVSLPHGFGHSRAGTRMSVAEKHSGVSINDLTDELLLDELTGNAAFCGVAVEVQSV